MEFWVSIWIINAIIHLDLGLSKRCARWVRFILIRQHLENSVMCAKELFAVFRRQFNDFLDSVVTTNELYVSHLKEQSKQNVIMWLKEILVPPKKEVMDISFINFKGLINTNYALKDRTIYSDYLI